MTASDDSTARLWDAKSGAELRRLSGHVNGVYHASFSSDGRRIVTSDQKSARIWDADTGDQLRHLFHQGEEVTSATFSPDGRRIVTTVGDMAALWDAVTGRLLAALRHGKTVNRASFSPDGQRVVTASGDNTARIWDVNTQKEVRALAGHRDAVNSASFSPDGRRIVTASSDKTARLWDADTGQELLVLVGHEHSVAGASFSPDGRRVVTASLDKTARLWDAASGVLLTNLDDHTGAVLSVAFSPDGSQIATASADRTARLWPLGGSPRKPIVQGIASSSAGAVWVVGSDGYAAYSSDGRSWALSPANETDLVAVATIGAEAAIALTADNKLVALNATGPARADQGAAGRQSTLQQRPSQAQVDAKADDQRGTIAQAGARRLRALSFRNANEGWVAGDGGLILHTRDGGRSWSERHARNGLALADLYIEEPGVGWAIGKYADGRQALVAANQAHAENSWRELPHHIGPWYFLLGIPLLLLAGFLMLRAWRTDPAPPQESIEEVATSDTPLRANDPDARALKPLARGLSRFLRNVNTRPPLTLAITGRWGSGKSSLMSLLMSDLQHHGGRTVWFNAWHHREEEHLLAALFAAIRRDAPPGWWSWPGLAFRVRLLWRRSKRPLLSLLYIALFAGIALLTVRLALPTLRLEELGHMLPSATAVVGPDVAATLRAGLGAVLAGSGGAALLALFGLWLRGKLVALPANPAKLVSALAKRASLGDFSDKLAFRHRFGGQFDDVCNALLTRTSPGLVILIDDLDRCQPEDVLKVLEAINYLVSAGPCVVVLGMDRRQIEYCVGLGFEKLVEGLPEDELTYAGEETADKSGKQRAFARHYLEKLINIEVPVPALDEAATDALLSRGTSAVKPDQGDPPRWLEDSKRVARAAFQIARVGLLAFFAGILLTWSVEPLREPQVVPAPPSSSAPPATSVQPSGPVTPTSPAAAQPQAPQGATFEPARIDFKATAATQEVPASRRWLWWAPTILLVGICLLFGAAAAAHRQRQVVQDSPRFAKALQAVKPLLMVVNATPRAIKRYQNRMRYLAARLRPATYEPDRIDSLLHWLGGRLGRPLVPAAWFEERPRQAIEEPALILLGALELFAPHAFANPIELFGKLEHGTPGDRRSDAQVDAWSRVRKAFAAEGLAMPTAPEIARYATFVLTLGRASSPAHSAEVVPFSRDAAEPR